VRLFEKRVRTQAHLDRLHEGQPFDLTSRYADLVKTMSVVVVVVGCCSMSSSPRRLLCCSMSHVRRFPVVFFVSSSALPPLYPFP